jgi:hypothetical protein
MVAPCSEQKALLEVKGTPSENLPDRKAIPSEGFTCIEKWLFPVTEVLSACHPVELLYWDDRVGFASTVYRVDKEFLLGSDSDSENPRTRGVTTAGGWIDATVTPIEFFKLPEEYVL